MPRIVVDESFGPVAVVRRVDSADEAVALGQRRACTASVPSCSAATPSAHAELSPASLDAGMVGINRGVGGASGTPWVGAKQSGYGFHHGPEGHRQFTQVRIVSESA